MLRLGDKVLGLRWLYHNGEPKLQVNRWNGDKRELGIEPFPFLPKCYIKREDKAKLHKTSDFKLVKTDYTTFKGKPVVQIDAHGSPSLIRDLREQNDIQFYQGDIPYGKNVFIALNLQIDELRPAYIDIEIDPRVMKFDLVAQPVSRLLSASIIDKKTGEKHFICFKSEALMFKELDQLCQQWGAWLSWSDLDYKYLRSRAKFLGLRVPYLMSMEGIDLMQPFGLVAYKSNSMTSNYIKLTVAAEKYKVKMEDYGVKENYSILWEWFENEEFGKLKKYNMQDVETLKEIDEVLQMSDAMEELIRKFNVFIEDFPYNSRIIDMMILRSARKRGWVLPNKPRWREGDSTWEEKKAAGGYVFDPTVGLHRNVACLDFRSMYPSIMRSLNVGLDTLDSQCLENSHRSAGTCFFSNPRSLNNEVVQQIKIWLDEYTERLDKAEPNSIEWQRAYLLRYRTKIAANADFGVMGAGPKKLKDGTTKPAIFRLYSKDVFESITLTGQELILRVGGILRDQKYDIIYGDTDSLFIRCQTDGLNKKEIQDYLRTLVQSLNIAIARYCENRFGTKIDTNIELAQYGDVFYMTEAAKRYYFHVLYESDQWTDYDKIQGFEIRRRDWTALAKEVQARCFAEIKTGKSREEIEASLREYLLKLKKDLFVGKLDDKIVFTKGLRKSISEYTVSLPHVRSAKILEEKGLLGMKDIEFMVIRIGSESYVNSSGKKARRRILETYPFIDGRPAIHESGYEYVWNGQVMAILERLGLFKEDAELNAEPNATIMDLFFGECMSEVYLRW